MKKIAVLLILAFVLFVSSCDDFFSKSWGSNRDYDPKNIHVTASNIDDWVKACVGNPDLTKATLKAISRELKKQPPLLEKDKKILFNAGLRLAVDSSGLGESILTIGAKSLKGLDFDDINEDKIKELLNDILKDFNSKGGPAAADTISDMVIDLIDVETGKFKPEFIEMYNDIFNPGDVSEAILVLVLGEMINNPNFVMNEWDTIMYLNDVFSVENNPKGGLCVEVNDPTDTNAIVLAAYINLVIDDPWDKYVDNPLANALKDMFLGK